MPDVLTSLERPRAFWLACVLIGLVALGLRVGLTAAFVGLNAPPDLAANPDQEDYELLAWRMSTGQGFTLEDGTATAWRPPGTSFMFPVYAVAGRDYAAGRMWFCLMSAATCLFAALIGREAFGPVVGVAAAALLALFPNHAQPAMHFVSEAPFAFWVAAATALTLRSIRQQAGPAWAAGAGLGWGCAALVRPNILLVLPLLWQMPWWMPLRRRLVPTLLVLSVTAAAVLMPWVVRNQRVFGHATLSTIGSAVFWGAHNPTTLAERPGGWTRTSDLADAAHPLSADEFERSDQMWRYSREFLGEHASALPYLEAMKLYRFFTPLVETDNVYVRWAFFLGWGAAGLLMIPGLLAGFKHDGPAAYVILCPVLALVVTAAIFYGSDRFRDSVAPIYIVFTALGVVAVLRKLTPRYQSVG